MVHGVVVGSGDSADAPGRRAAATRPRTDDQERGAEPAEELAALGRHHEGSRALERGESIDAADDGEGLYARRGRLANRTEAFMTSWAGRIEVRLGRASEGLAKLRQWDSAPSGNIRTPAIRLADVALGHTVAGDPEPACNAAARSLDASHAAGYRVGVDRVRRVRDAMRPEWSSTAWVRDLDERLRVLT